MLALWVGVGLFTGAGGTVVTPPPTSGGAGNYNFLNRRKSKREDEDEKDDLVSREALTVVKISKAPNETITGLVVPKRQVETKGRNRIHEITKTAFDLAKAKSDKLRAIQLADDEWLLLN